MTQNIEFIGTSGERYLAQQRLAQGGQGVVYHVKASGDGKDYALKWYHSNRASNSQREQLEKLARHRPPLCDVADILFVWPIEMVRWGNHPSYGYVMPLYDTDRFVHYNRVINGRVRQPRRDILLRMSYLACMALEAVHRSGLAYCDINLGNMNFDVESGSLVVCDNDNVVVNNSDAAVYGIAEFMAPEVARAQGPPNAQTDLYSLAVMLYQLWMWEHPMEGEQTAAVRCWDQPAKLKHYAEAPLFAHHPTDRRNAASGDPMLAYSVRRWNEICPRTLKELFTRVFTEGVHQPGRRPRLSEWLLRLQEAEANAAVCPACRAVNLLAPESAGTVCYNCGQRYPVHWVLDIRTRSNFRSYLVLREGATLRGHHLEGHTGGGRSLEVLGRVEAHPKEPGALILRNLTREDWLYAIGATQYRIEPGKARALLPDGAITAGSATLSVETISRHAY